MPRNISFFLTQQQIRDKSKTVTRRDGWKFLKIGDVLNACEKCQGIGKGNKIVKICQIKVVDVRFEPLYNITPEDVLREGFPNMTKFDFIDFYMEHNKCQAHDIVTRIEFEYL